MSTVQPVTERLAEAEAALTRAREEIVFWRGQAKAHARAASRARHACLDLALGHLPPTRARRQPGVQTTGAAS